MSNKHYRFSNAFRAPIEVHNEILIFASPERVWDVLTDVRNWPSWYLACRWVRVKEIKQATSKESSRQLESFSWKAQPLVLHSTVVHSLWPHCFNMTADCVGFHAERKFTLCPGPNGFGTTVVSHETLYGLFPWLGRAIFQRRLRDANQDMFNDLRAASVGIDKKSGVASQKKYLMKRFNLLLVAIAILTCVAALMSQAFQRTGEDSAPSYGPRPPLGYTDWTQISVAPVGESHYDHAKPGNEVGIETYREGKTDFPDGTIVALEPSHVGGDEQCRDRKKLGCLP
jgi:hypothetical protein